MWVFGKLDLEVSEAIKELNDLDHLVVLDDVVLGQDLVGKRAEAQSYVWKKIKLSRIVSQAEIQMSLVEGRIS